RLPEPGAVGGIAPSDDGAHPDGAAARIDLGEVDDLAAVELAVVGGLSEAVDEGLERRQDEGAAIESLVVLEAQADELEAEAVPAAVVLLGELRRPQRREHSMQARLGDLELAREPVKRDSLRMARELLQDEQDAAGADNPRLRRLTGGVEGERMH